MNIYAGTNQDNGERSVGVHVTAIGRELELAGRHIVDTRNITHRRRVARATLNLETVCDRLADTEVDEVVAIRNVTAKSL